MANKPSRDMTFDNVKHKIMQTIYKSKCLWPTIKIGRKTSNRINIKFMTITHIPPSSIERNIREMEQEVKCFAYVFHGRDMRDAVCVR